MQNYNCACCYVWVYSLTSDIEGGTQAEGVLEQSAGEDIWAEEGRGKTGVEKTT